MQQFARRSDSSQQPPSVPTPDATTEQMQEKIRALTDELVAVRAELEAVNTENERLRQCAPTSDEPHTQEVQHAPQPPTTGTEEGSVDEESLVELVRTTSAQFEDPTPTEPPATAPISDDEVQRLLAEAANEALEVDTVPQTSGTEPEAQPTAEDAPPLRLEEAEPQQDDRQVFEVSFTLDHKVAAKVPANLAIAALAVPHRIEDNKIVVKTAEPFDYPSLDMVADATAHQIVPEAAPIEEVVTALRALYGETAREFEADAAWAAATAKPEKKKRLGLFRRSA